MINNMARNNSEKPLLSDELRGREKHVYGPKSVTGVAVSNINVLPQIRTEFDPVGIEELADSMLVYEKMGEQYVIVGFNLQAPTIVAKLTPEEAITYTVEHALLHKKLEPSEVKVAKDGFVYILIAGERRMRAIKCNQEYTGLDIDKTEVMCSIQEGISLLDAHGNQLTENVHDRPSPLDEAVGIRQTRDYLTMRFPGQFPHITDIVRISGRSECVVRSALAFTSLPEEIQAMAKKTMHEYGEEGKKKTRPFTPIPYSVIVRLKPLEEAYRLKHKVRGIEEPEDEYVKNYLLAFATNIQAFRLKHKLENSRARVSSHIRKLIDEKIRNVLGEASFDMETFLLFEDDEKPERSAAALKRAQKNLANTAVLSLLYLQKGGAIDRDTASMIEDLFMRVAVRDEAIAEVLDEVK